MQELLDSNPGVRSRWPSVRTPTCSRKIAFEHRRHQFLCADVIFGEFSRIEIIRLVLINLFEMLLLLSQFRGKQRRQQFLC